MELFLQCRTGLSGDMVLAVLADLGLDLEPLQDLLNRAGLDVRIESSKELRNGLTGRGVRIHAGRHQPFRHLSTILELVDQAGLSAEVKSRSGKAFQRLAEVEAHVHGQSLEEVHFHEVGAVDTIADVVGTFWGLEQLGVTRVSCSDLPWFDGQVKTEHGLLPLPAPATAALLQGKPVYPTAFDREIITPTGALIVDQVVSHFQPGPRGRVSRVGTGWGDMDLGATPNGLRGVLFSGQATGLEQIVVLETNIDHLTGEELGDCLEVLHRAGALDVVYTPGVMKKNRPGGILQVLCRPEQEQDLLEAVFAHSLTLGVRRQDVQRVVLPRREAMLDTELGQVQAKAMDLGRETVARPEYEALKALSEKTGRSVAQLRHLLGGGFDLSRG